MIRTKDGQRTVVRTGRGLSVAGTRITLYSVMDYIKADWPPKLIQAVLNLTDKQIADVIDYADINHPFETHRVEVEAEYQEVLQQAKENREYWEARNRERLAKIASMAEPSEPGQEEIRAKLQAAKARLGI